MEKQIPALFGQSAEKRKLAAVMFADIEGYTALFQQHEQAALEQINTHRDDLKQHVEEHQGQIIKYYGDGSLTVFNSVLEATQCAIDVQQASLAHSIPLRIGIHMGELIEKENDVYGDAVNIASRIQAIGIPGSILISHTVANELKNHPNASLHPLGDYELKNVRKPVSIFAVNAPGLVVPQTLHVPRHLKSRNRYYWVGSLVLIGLTAVVLNNMLTPAVHFRGEDCFIVPPFTTDVQDSAFQYFSQTIASYIGKRLRESAGVNIISERSLSYYSNANVANAGITPSIARKAGARYAIEGHFGLEGLNRETLRIWMSITDLRTGAALPISIPDVICRAENKMDCVQEASSILAGYWRSSKDFLFQFTNDSAYTAYLIAQEKWGNPALRDEVKRYLIKAITYDPKFIDAWFLMLDWFYNKREYQNAIDTIALIRQQIPSLDARKQHYLKFYESDFAGKRQLAFDFYYKEYLQNKWDLFTNTTGMVLAMEYLNDPELALRLFGDIDPDSIDFSTCTYCMTRFTMALQAYTSLHQFDYAASAASRLKPFATKESQFLRFIDYYVAIRDTISIHEIIQQSLITGEHADDEQYYCYIAARAAALRNDVVIRDRFAHRVLQLSSDSATYDMARTYLLLNDLPNAKKNFEMLIQQFSTDPRYYGFLGVILARNGETAKARQMMEEVKKHKPKFDYGETTYMQARIAANLGDQKKALSLCKIALSEGFKFRHTVSFTQDPDMAVMNEVPEYIALLRSFRGKY